MNTTVRNVAILVLLALAVTVLPGGGQVAALIGALLSIVFAGGVAFFAGRTYLEHRIELHSLDDRSRALLYASIGGLAVSLTAASRLLDTGVGAFVLIVVLSLCGYGLFYVYQAWRQY